MQRGTLLNIFNRHSIRCEPSGEKEIALLCPKCSPRHNSRKHTLYVNTVTGSFICFRCEPRLASRGGEDPTESLNKLMDVFGLPHIQSAAPITNLQELRNKLLHKDRSVPLVKFDLQSTQWPEGYSTDWSSHAGKYVLRYLAQRGVTSEQIEKYRIGCVDSGAHVGSVVLPVFMNNKLVFWQLRRCLFGFGSGAKYFGCPGVKRAYVLFGYDGLSNKAATLVEGIFDAIAVGDDAVALLGKTISDFQISLLARRRIQKVTVMLDADAEAEATYLAARLDARLWTLRERSTVYRLPPGVDPADHFKTLKDGFRPKNRY